MSDIVKSVSKYMSYLLRHRPDAAGLTLDVEGWVVLDDLLDAIRRKWPTADLALFERVVAENDKTRFVVDRERNLVRAAQGHSVQVDLGLPRLVPPELLYHGTATRFLESIRQQGLIRGRRHHVHLSSDETTAAAVGGRHGRAVVLTVRAGRMHHAGIPFFRSENGVWLVDAVPVDYLIFP